MADALNTIEPLPEYDDPILDGLVMAGYQAGFEHGKFEVEAKLFAIDVGVMLIEFALLEVALGPLGGARLLASAVSKGAKALTTAVKRLENIPIFIPGATNGVGGFVRIGKITTSVSAKVHRYQLRRALEKELKRKKAAGESTHHIVALEDEPAREARTILDKFNIKIDEAVNGVFLPATKSSPNPTGAIVHATLRNGEYYDRVNRFLRKARSQADLIKRLKRIRETLLDGTFYDAIK
ncbi:MAG: AHH domain-containing protein [Polyangiaceae bacterium]|nr:AHH domain-containing protein [Polyangiaceae bacterium]